MSIGVAKDFEESTITSTPVITSGGTLWNTEPWGDPEMGTFSWAMGKTFFKDWQIVDQEGTTISLVFKTDTKGVRVRLFSADVMFEKCAVTI